MFAAIAVFGPEEEASGLVARGAISIFDIITCHITITFVPGSVVCIVVIGSHII